MRGFATKETIDKVKAMAGAGKQLVRKQDIANGCYVIHVEPSEFPDGIPGDIISVRNGESEYTYQGEDGFQQFLDEWEVR